MNNVGLIVTRGCDVPHLAVLACRVHTFNTNSWRDPKV